MTLCPVPSLDSDSPLVSSLSLLAEGFLEELLGAVASDGRSVKVTKASSEMRHVCPCFMGCKQPRPELWVSGRPAVFKEGGQGWGPRGRGRQRPPPAPFRPHTAPYRMFRMKIAQCTARSTLVSTSFLLPLPTKFATTQQRRWVASNILSTSLLVPRKRRKVGWHVPIHPGFVLSPVVQQRQTHTTRLDGKTARRPFLHPRGTNAV